MFLTSTLSNWRLSFSSSYFLEKVENNNILSYVYLHPSCNKHNITIALQYSPYKIGRYPVFPTTKKAVQRQSFLFLFLFLFCYLMSKRFSNFKKSYVWGGGRAVYTCSYEILHIARFYAQVYFFRDIPIEVNEVIAIYQKKICKRPKVFWHICKCQFTGDCNKCVFIHET